MTATEGTKSQNRSFWPGLEPYSSNDAERFFGRSREIADLVQRIRRRVITVLFAESGVGKTSLLRAGVFKLLEGEGFRPIYIRLDHSKKAAALVDQIWDHLDKENLVSPAHKRAGIWEWMHDTSTGLQAERTKGATPVLVFDQFEEIYTIGARFPERAAQVQDFLEQLADLIENRMPIPFQAKVDREEVSLDGFDLEADSYRVVVALREDYLSLLDRERNRMPSVMQNRMLLDRLHGDKALEVVTHPARDIVSSDVGLKIIRYVAGDDMTPVEDLVIEPALLSLVCRELDLARGDGPITEQLISGQKDEILQNFYSQCFEGISDEVRSFVEEELITESGHRQSLVFFGVEKAIGTEALSKLIDRRLLHTEQHGQVPRVELTHDILVPVVSRSRAAALARKIGLEAEEKDREARRREELAAENILIERSKRYRLAWWLGASMAVTAAAVVFALLAIHFRGQAKQTLDNLKKSNLELTEAVLQAKAAEAAAEQAKESSLKSEKKATEAAESQKISAEQARLAADQATKAERRTRTYLQGLFDKASLLMSDATDETSGLAPRMRLILLDKARVMYRSLDDDQLKAQIEDRLFQVRVGEVQAAISALDYKQALAFIDLAEEEIKQFDAERQHAQRIKIGELRGDVVWERALVLHSRAETLKDEKDPSKVISNQASKALEDAGELYRQALKETSPNTLERIRIRNKLAGSLIRLKSREEATKLLDESREDLARMSGDEPEIKVLLGDTINKQGVVSFTSGIQPAKALALFAEATELRREIVAKQPDSAGRIYDLAVSTANLSDAQLLNKNSRERETHKIFLERIELARRLYAKNPENLYYRRFYAEGLRRMAIRWSTRLEKSPDNDNFKTQFLHYAREAVVVGRFEDGDHLRTYRHALRTNNQQGELSLVNKMIGQLDKEKKIQ